MGQGGGCEHRIDRRQAAAAARGLALERGGSFGFRGHRCEALVLEGAERNGIFKVALGGRCGPSVDGIITLLADIAAFPSVAAARAALCAAGADRVRLIIAWGDGVLTRRHPAI